MVILLRIFLKNYIFFIATYIFGQIWQMLTVYLLKESSSKWDIAKLYYLRFFLIVTLWRFTLFTNCTLTLVCDLYMNKNIVLWDLVRFVLVCILLICSFYIFYKYKIRDIKAQSSASAYVKSVSVTIKKKRR